jgi:uncharacterized protein
MNAASGHEWPATLDVPAVLADGWTPEPFTEFVIKIHSRCDLSCDYCYMYEMADQSWRDQPRKMSDEIADLAARRIGEHARGHKLPRVAITLHGGEPLLAGPRLIEHLVDATRREAGPDVVVEAGVQTNAVGLNETFLDLFDRLGLQVGVSLDGTAKGHDRHRRFASGRSSYVAVRAGLDRLISKKYRHLFGGLLCTIDLRNDPLDTYAALADFDPPAVDFLLPHGTWAAPPPGRIPGAPETPYADWLISIFDYWYYGTGPPIRLFADIMHLLLGGTSSAEMIGLSPTRVLVIETDGTLEQGDTLKAAFHGAARTGLNLTDDPLDAALTLPGIVARQLGIRALGAECRICQIRRVCGGGLYAHRYRPGSGFASPSIYCPDLMRLITHIWATIRADIRSRPGGNAL